MSKKNEAWGIEVGAQAIKVLKLARAGNGVHLEDFEVLPFKHILTTPDLNAEEAIRVNLEALAQKYEFDKSTVVVSVPGHMAFARFAKLPPVEASKVKSIVAYEAQQQIPFPIDEVEWDYQVFAQEDAPDIEVGIFAITKERVAQYLSNYRSVGLRVDALTLSPVAVYNTFAYENEAGGAEGENTVYLDIGTVSTDIIVVESGSIWLRTLQLGGNHFTNALMKQFKISFAKAEKLKLEASTSKYAKQIFQAMRGVFSELVTEIQRSLGFYQSLNRDSELTRIVGVGSTWKLPGLTKYLKQNLQMEVVRPDGYRRLEVDGRRAAEFSSVAVNMATAYGLALQGLGLEAVEANILPQAVLRQRMWKAKQPWFGAAAACVAGAAGVGAVMQLMKSSAYEAAYDRSMPPITQTISRGQELKGQYDQLQTTDPRPAIRNYRRSFDYNDLYPKLLEDIATAMTQIQPNPALADIDWNDPAQVQKAMAVPRRERGLAWITKVTTRYGMASSDSAGSTDTVQDSGGFADEFGGEFGGGFSGGGFTGSTGDGAAVGLTPMDFPEQPEPIEGEPPPPSTGPRITVTITGDTTMDRPTATREIEQQFIAWIRDNASRPDRPYTFVVADPPEITFLPRGASGTGSGRGGGGGFDFGGGGSGGLSRTPTPASATGTPGFSGSLDGGFSEPPGSPSPGPGGLDQFGPGGGAPANAVRDVKTPEGWYAQFGAGGGGGGFSFEQLVPRRPLSTEPTTDDYTFTFEFEVILLPPDEARKTLSPRPEPEPGDGEEPPADDANQTATRDLQEQDS